MSHEAKEGKSILILILFSKNTRTRMTFIHIPLKHSKNNQFAKFKLALGTNQFSSLQETRQISFVSVSFLYVQFSCNFLIFFLHKQTETFAQSFYLSPKFRKKNKNGERRKRRCHSIFLVQFVMKSQRKLDIRIFIKKNFPRKKSEKIKHFCIKVSSSNRPTFVRSLGELCKCN